MQQCPKGMLFLWQKNTNCAGAHDTHCRQNGIGLIPLAVESFGGCSAVAMDTVSV